MNPPDMPTPEAPVSRPRRWLLGLLAGAAFVVVVFVAALLVGRPVGQPGASQGLPWQVEAEADGSSRVFDLHIGRSRLGDLRARFGDSLQVGVILPHGQAPALEGFVDNLAAGFVTGKLVMAFDADPAWLRGAQERSPRSEVGEGGRSRRYRLAADDADRAERATLQALAFLPSARLDEATIVQRFGEPDERLRGPGGELQLLYPERGIAVALPPAEGDQAKARVVIQYTAPRDFEARLIAPLRAAGAASASGGASAP